jgi:phytoene dehydrogenase-like protein
MPEPVIRALHFIDRDAGGQILTDDPVTTPQDRDRYLVTSLVEEAITSSQLEGAATTRHVAEDMLRAGRKPRTHGERMIFNNYLAPTACHDPSQKSRETLRVSRATTASYPCKCGNESTILQG